MSAPDGSHDDLMTGQGYDDPLSLLKARCDVLDSLDLARRAAWLVHLDGHQLTGPMREDLQFEVMRLGEVLDALSDALRAAPGGQP